jgi:hypothetical protein
VKTDPEDQVSAYLTKREHFAALALQALLANPYYAQQMDTGERLGSAAQVALFHADELIAALNKESP